MTEQELREKYLAIYRLLEQLQPTDSEEDKAWGQAMVGLRYLSIPSERVEIIYKRKPYRQWYEDTGGQAGEKGYERQ